MTDGPRGREGDNRTLPLAHDDDERHHEHREGHDRELEPEPGPRVDHLAQLDGGEPGQAGGGPPALRRRGA
jgi:hypothetical protein